LCVAGIWPMPAATRRYLIQVRRPLPAAPLVKRCSYLAVVPRPMLASLRRNLIAVPRSMPVAPRRYLAVVPRPLPAAPLVARRRYLVVAPGCCPRRSSLCVACTWSWCSGRYPKRRSLCIAGLCSFFVVPRPSPAAALVVRRRYFIVAPGRCPRRRAGS
jgi:hypothetical protein